MTDKRLLTKQLEKLREIFIDIVDESELLELEALRSNVDKGLNIVISMEEDNKNKREGER